MIFLDKLICKHAPHLKRQLFKGASITMIGYGEMPYETKSSSGIWPLICLAPQKGSTNLYVSAGKDGEPIVRFYGKKLGKITFGKTCL